MIAITVDTEWCPDPVIEDTVSLLDQYGVEATLFSTHDDGVTAADHERALHPNFMRGEENERDALAEVAAKFPDATGVRSHSMYVHSRLRDLYDEFGLTYESNYMQYLVKEIEPFWMIPGTVQFPVYFMDDMWFRTRRTPEEVPPAGKLLNQSGLKVFDFHPVHIFLNTTDPDHYAENKDMYDDPERLRDGRAEGPGVRNLFVNILEEIEAGSEESTTLGNLATSFSERNPEESIQL